jgi:hypothetical protein
MQKISTSAKIDHRVVGACLQCPVSDVIRKTECKKHVLPKIDVKQTKDPPKVEMFVAKMCQFSFNF